MNDEDRSRWLCYEKEQRDCLFKAFVSERKGETEGSPLRRMLVMRKNFFFFKMENLVMFAESQKKEDAKEPRGMWMKQFQGVDTRTRSVGLEEDRLLFF